MKVTDKIKITCEDNMELMAKHPENHFDLAIVDPPYGIGWASKPASSSGVRTQSKTGAKSVVKGTEWIAKDWDLSQPDQSYFDELLRVSKNQIIWGSNYLSFNQKHQSSGRIFWDKVNPQTSFSDGELAWCSMINTIRQIEYMWNGMMQGKGITDGRVQQANKKKNEKKIHPTQKPVKLYEWLLMKFTTEGDKILDTHLGSGSIAVACHNLGFELTACELDKEYYEAAIKRIENHVDQLSIF